MKLILAGLLFIGISFAQSGFDQQFTTTKTTSLTSAAEVLTVQHLATAKRSITFLTGYAYCSSDCTITLERSGTAATTTSNTIVNLNPNNTFSQGTSAQAFNTSNVGVGTVINTYNLTGGSFISIDLTYFQLSSGLADNLTLRGNSITGTQTLQLTWKEL